MKLFEYFRTTFNIIKAFITQDYIIYIGLGVLALFVLWSILSLSFCYEKRFSKQCKRIAWFLQSNKITSENYFQFTKKFSVFPTATCRKWRQYERTQRGVPSDYVTTYDCIEQPLEGGLHKQNRSLMKFAINTIVIFSFILSLATIDSEATSITPKLLVEAAIVPFVLMLLYRVNYYIYTAIRHNEYKIAVDEFEDFVDILDEKINMEQIFEGKEGQLVLFSNIYNNQLEKQINVSQRRKNDKTYREVTELSQKRRNNAGKPFTKGTISSETNSRSKNLKNFEIKNSSDYEIFNNSILFEADAFKNKEGKVEIKDQTDFEKALELVERLLDSESRTESLKIQEEKTKKITELMEAMNKYRKSKMK